MRVGLRYTGESQRWVHFPGRAERTPEYVLPAQSSALRSSCSQFALCQPKLPGCWISASDSSIHPSPGEKLCLRLRKPGEFDDRARNCGLLEIQPRIPTVPWGALEPCAGCE